MWARYDFALGSRAGAISLAANKVTNDQLPRPPPLTLIVRLATTHSLLKSASQLNVDANDSYRASLKM